jgi:hypothetical protein
VRLRWGGGVRIFRTAAVTGSARSSRLVEATCRGLFQIDDQLVVGMRAAEELWCEPTGFKDCPGLLDFRPSASCDELGLSGFKAGL